MQNYTVITKQGKAKEQWLICQSINAKKWLLTLTNKRGQFHQHISNMPVTIQFRNEYIVIVVVSRKECAKEKKGHNVYI
jgi:hypothetical protein